MSYEEQDVIWRVALASYDPREMRVWTRYLEERNPAIRCTGYRSSRTLLERLEQGDVDVLVLGGRLEDMDSIQFLPRIRGLARKPLVLLRDDGRNEKSAVESLSQEDACYLIRQPHWKICCRSCAPQPTARRRAWKSAASASISAGA